MPHMFVPPWQAKVISKILINPEACFASEFLDKLVVLVVLVSNGSCPNHQAHPLD